MESFTLTRRDMAHLLLAMEGRRELQPLAVLQDAWRRTHSHLARSGSTIPTFLYTDVTPVLDKIIKGKHSAAFSLQEIVSLGQLVEYSHVSLASMQNWVKRDFKEFLGAPKIGKKYSVNQAAILLIVEDLKSCLDFESIRQLFHILFQQPEDDTDDLIQPVDLYAAYSTLFEELDANGDQLLDVAVAGFAKDNGISVKGQQRQESATEELLVQAADQYTSRLQHLTPNQCEAVRNTLLVAAVAVQNSYFLSMARRYVNATLFLDFQG
ncbi:DUF1836 domain-containing protein [Paenibacillus polymyxa]|uniref:DUF1836 domain-containing protein n=1 Tax=Paenibacillus TaxID=44249 RepID=UPI0020248C0D|nr:DUF1836 domain-containing protein [Paenibacillus polymyxa]URJ38914.1 DUF1836 domain-containing protein [Paenibacillus polymyxa]